MGISFSATLINLPLTCVPALKPRPPPKPQYNRVIEGEDADFVEAALRGEWIPRKKLQEINEERFSKGQQLLVIPFNKYENEKDQLVQIRKNAKDDLVTYNMNLTMQLRQMDSKEAKEKVVKMLELSRAPLEKRDELGQDLGNWFKDYLIGAGYFVDESPFMYKQMIMEAFPPLREEGTELSADNLEQTLLNSARVVNKYHNEEIPTFHNRAFARRYGMYQK